MPDMKVLAEVIGGSKTVVQVGGNPSIPELAALTADVDNRSLTDDDGSPLPWILYVPNGKGGFSPAPREEAFEDLETRIVEAEERGTTGDFPGPGNEDGEDYRFRIRLFVPSPRPPPRPVDEGPRPIAEDEDVIDLTNIDNEGDDLVSVRRVAGKRRRRRKKPGSGPDTERRRKRRAGGGQRRSGETTGRMGTVSEPGDTPSPAGEDTSADETPSMVMDSSDSLDGELAFLSADNLEEESSLADGEDSVADAAEATEGDEPDGDGDNEELSVATGESEDSVDEPEDREGAESSVDERVAFERPEHGEADPLDFSLTIDGVGPRDDSEEAEEEEPDAEPEPDAQDAVTDHSTAPVDGPSTSDEGVAISEDINDPEGFELSLTYEGPAPGSAAAEEAEDAPEGADGAAEGENDDERPTRPGITELPPKPDDAVENVDAAEEGGSDEEVEDDEEAMETAVAIQVAAGGSADEDAQTTELAHDAVSRADAPLPDIIDAPTDIHDSVDVPTDLEDDEDEPDALSAADEAPQEGADTEDTPDDDPPTDPVPEAGGASETEAAEAGADQAEASPPARKKRRRKRKKKKKSSNALLILLLMAFLAACVGLGALLYSQGVLG